jgi:hypothetical protein
MQQEIGWRPNSRIPLQSSSCAHHARERRPNLVHVEIGHMTGCVSRENPLPASGSAAARLEREPTVRIAMAQAAAAKVDIVAKKDVAPRVISLRVAF